MAGRWPTLGLLLGAIVSTVKARVLNALPRAISDGGDSWRSPPPAACDPAMEFSAHRTKFDAQSHLDRRSRYRQDQAKLRRHLEQMRAMVDNLDLSFAKKGRLFNRINALQQEIDRDRTRYEMLAGLVVDGSDNLAQVADRWLPTLQAIVKRR